jgi:hypothetical protein
MSTRHNRSAKKRPVDVDAPPTDETDLHTDTDPATMRLHITALEDALEQQSNLVAELRSRLEAQTFEQLELLEMQPAPVDATVPFGPEPALKHEPDLQHRDVQRMLLTIRGLREGMGGEPATERVLGRVEAAIRRLDPVSAAALDRPILPAFVAPSEPAPVAKDEAPAAETPEDDTSDEPTAVEPVQGETVMPVPRTTTDTHPSRNKRRKFRNSHAAA